MSCPADNVLLALVEQTLEQAQLRDIERHVDGCPHCQRVVAAALAAGSTAADTPASLEDDAALAALVGVTIGERYAIKSIVGRGGVGAVFLARDLSLGRDVALKLHRAGSGNDRLHREAIAMAQLAHPNVVTVHEVGVHDERLYVAMEYVRGDTLRGWLAAAPRTWREIVDLLLAAGKGLAAAHAAELVHRDFKPENVLVGEDGRPRVSDFGLARVEGRPSGVIPLTPGSSLDTPMTVTGAVMGTPAYMALEQLAGAAVDARSDQFAFCVVAWECLYGTRPFLGSTLAALALAIERQELQPLPKRTTVPERVRKVLERGLRADHTERYPNLPALLAELRTAAAPRTRRTVAVAAAALVPLAAGAFFLARSSTSDTAARCKVDDSALAGAWDGALRDKIQAAFSPLKQGDQLFARVTSTLDDYRHTWVAMRQATCEATRVRGEQSESLLDIRMACLDRKRDELRSLAQGLADADRPTALGAVRAALGLTPVADCGDRSALAPVRPPDPQLRDRVEAERASLAEVRALRLLGRTKPALEKARAIAARAKDLQYRPLEAEALVVLGDLEDRGGDTATAIKVLEQAVVAADAGNHRRVAAEAWSTIAWLEGYVQRRFDRAQWAVRMAGAAIEALGGSEELSAQLANYEALILDTKGQLEPARTKYLAALSARERMGPRFRDSWQAAMVLNDLATVERKIGDYEASRAHHERALAIRRKVFGDAHPYVFSSVLNLGNLAWSRHDYKAAEARYREALAMAGDVFPAQHPQTALALANLASSLDHQEQFPEAIATYRRALAMYEAVRGPDHPEVADTLRNLGSVLARADQRDEARQVFERALAILDTKKDDSAGEDDPALASVLCDYGDLLASTGQQKQAEPLLVRSVALGTKIDPDDSELAFALTALGELYTSQNHAARALPLLERALVLRKEDSEDKARTQLALANALWRSDRTRALALAQAAERQHGNAKLHAKVQQWLASHR